MVRSIYYCNFYAIGTEVWDECPTHTRNAQYTHTEIGLCSSQYKHDAQYQTCLRQVLIKFYDDDDDDDNGCKADVFYIQCVAISLSPPVTRICPSTLSALGTVTTDEVARVIRLLPQKTSPLDIMPVSLLKLSADIMAPLIARLAIYLSLTVFSHPGTRPAK